MPARLALRRREAWAGYPLPHAWPDVYLDGVAAGPKGYVISGADRDLAASGPLPEAQRRDAIWTSADGESWTRIGAVDDTGAVWLLAVAPTGRIIVGMTSVEAPGSGILSSQDGRAWDALAPADLGVDALRVGFLGSTASEVLLGGNACDECTAQVWTSTNGISWKAAWEFANWRTGITSIATDGRVLVAALNTCVDTVGCNTQLWSSIPNGPWVLRYDPQDIEDSKVAFTGTAFVAVGIVHDGYSTLASIDGETWTEIPSDGLPDRRAFTEDCAPGWLTASDETIRMGQQGCSAWRAALR